MQVFCKFSLLLKQNKEEEDEEEEKPNSVKEVNIYRLQGYKQCFKTNHAASRFLSLLGIMRFLWVGGGGSLEHLRKLNSFEIPCDPWSNRINSCALQVTHKCLFIKPVSGTWGLTVSSSKSPNQNLLQWYHVVCFSRACLTKNKYQSAKQVETDLRHKQLHLKKPDRFTQCTP